MSTPASERADLREPDGAFVAVFRAHFAAVYRYLRGLGVPPAPADDAAQEVFLVLLRREHDPTGSMRAWLFGVARHVAWRQRRTYARQARLTEALTHAIPTMSDGPTVVAEREAAGLLDRFLDSLDDDKRAVFLMAELEQMTAPEIARALEIKENTVYSRLRAARQEFDRSFARVRLRERRATGEPMLDERALLLSRARRAYEPSPASRQRVWICLLGHTPPPGAALNPVPLDSSAGIATIGTTTQAHAAWAAVVALAGFVVVASAPANPPTAAARTHETSRTWPIDPVLDNMSSAPSPSIAPLAETPVPGGEPRPSTLRRDPPRRSPAPRAIVIPEPPAPREAPAPAIASDALRRETALMTDARTQLRAGAWEQASALLERHAREFPNGALADERDLSWVTALCSIGQVDVARAEAARIAGERPGIAHKLHAQCLGEISPTTLAASGE